MRRVPAVAAIVLGAAMVDRRHRHVRLHEGERRREPHRRRRGVGEQEGVVRLRNDVTTVDAGQHGRWSSRCSPRSPRSWASARPSSSSGCGPPTPRRPPRSWTNGTPIFASIDKTVANLEAHQDDYDAADAIPTSFIPLTVDAVVRTRLRSPVDRPRRVGLAAAGPCVGGVVALAGALLITFTLVAKLPSKGAQAERPARLAEHHRGGGHQDPGGVRHLQTWASRTCRQVFVEFAQVRGVDA